MDAVADSIIVTSEDAGPRDSSDVVQYVQPCCTYVRTERKSTYTYYVRTMGSTILLIGEFVVTSYKYGGLYTNSVG
jgi:hypothetical protein